MSSWSLVNNFAVLQHTTDSAHCPRTLSFLASTIHQFTQLLTQDMLSLQYITEERSSILLGRNTCLPVPCGQDDEPGWWSVGRACRPWHERIPFTNIELLHDIDFFHRERNQNLVKQRWISWKNGYFFHEPLNKGCIKYGTGAVGWTFHQHQSYMK